MFLIGSSVWTPGPQWVGLYGKVGNQWKVEPCWRKPVTTEASKVFGHAPLLLTFCLLIDKLYSCHIFPPMKDCSPMNCEQNKPSISQVTFIRYLVVATRKVSNTPINFSHICLCLSAYFFKNMNWHKAPKYWHDSPKVVWPQRPAFVINASFPRCKLWIPSCPHTPGQIHNTSTQTWNRLMESISLSYYKQEL